MKNQKVIAAALGLTLSLGALATGGVLSAYADDTAKKQARTAICQEVEADNYNNDPLFICEENSLEQLLKELEENNVLSKVELEQYKKAEMEIDKLYENVDFEKMTDKEFDKLYQEEDKIYDKNKVIYDKVDMYFTSLDDMLMLNLYDDYLKSGKLTEKEVDKLIQADFEADKLLSTITEDSTEEEINKIYDQVDKLYEGLDFVFDEIYDDMMLY